MKELQASCKFSRFNHNDFGIEVKKVKSFRCVGDNYYDDGGNFSAGLEDIFLFCRIF